MDVEETILAFIDAFEDTYLDDDWSRLEEYFTPDATYNTGDGQHILGRESILSYLKESVEGLDRRFDSRHPVFDDPNVTEKKVTVTWVFTFRKKGAPDLVSSGAEIAEIIEGKISKLESVFDEGVAERFQKWFEKYGELLIE